MLIGSRSRGAVRPHRPLRRLIAGVSIAVSAAAGPALASEAPQGESAALEEVVVTAQRREQRLQDTPIAVTAFSSTELAARNVDGMEALDGFVPNLDISSGNAGSGSGSNSQITIRGIGQTDFLIATDPAVGVYVDGVYVARSVGGLMDLGGIERVEVLRGPQGTLYGKNTIGGAINLVTAKPSQEWFAEGELTIGRFDRADARATVNIPLGSTLALRAAVMDRRRDGYGRRTSDGGELGDQNSTTGRAALRWQPRADLTVDLSLDRTRTREHSVVTTLREVNTQAPLFGLFNVLARFTGLVPPYLPSLPTDPYVSGGSGPNVNDVDINGSSLDVNWSAGENWSIRSLTAYRSLDAEFGRDGDNTTVAYVETRNSVRQHQASQELQFAGKAVDGRLDWLFGAYWFNERATDKTLTWLASGIFQALEALPGPVDGSPLSAPTAPGGRGNPINVGLDLDFDLRTRVEVRSVAAFTQESLRLNDRWSVTGGLRFSRDRKTFNITDVRRNALAPVLPPTEQSDAWTSSTPRVALEYRAADDRLYYASVSRGFKSGGFNGRPTQEGELTSFAPEYVTAYEAGIKSEWLDRRLRVNGAAFYYDYTDIQLVISAVRDGNFITLTENAGKAKVSGGELELQAQVTPAFRLDGSLGYVDARYTSVGTAQSITIDSKFPLTSKVTASAAAQYRWSLGGAGSLTARVDGTYRSEYYLRPENEPSLRQGGVGLLGARVAYVASSGRWQVALLGTNLTDRRYMTNGIGTLPSFGLAEAFYARPREWAASFSASF